MQEFKDSTSGVVGDVDCTVHEDLCGKHGVDGYPTIKWGKIGDLKDYNGERELEDLRKFAKENLGPVCGPKSLDICDETQKKHMQEAIAMTDDVLKAKLKEKGDEVARIEKEHEAAVNKLETAKNAKVDALNKDGLSSMQLVWDDRHPPPKEPKEPEPEEDPMADEGEDDMDGDYGDDAQGDDGKEDL